MSALRLADLTALAAFALLTAGLLRNLADRSEDPKQGLVWTRSGTLLLWAGLALRLGFPSGAVDPAVWLLAVPALAFAGLLHLLHVQGWKGPQARPFAWACWGLTALALALEILLRLR